MTELLLYLIYSQLKSNEPKSEPDPVFETIEAIIFVASLIFSIWFVFFFL